MKFFSIPLTKIFTFLCITIILVNIGSIVYAHKNTYLAHDYWKRFPQLKQTYLDSQYVNKHPKGWIPDETLNAYAGGAQIQGVSPILINPDTPPLGRYLIGLSALLFNNENIFNLFFVVGSLCMLYLLGKQVFQKTYLALLPPLFLSFEPIFLNQIAYTPLLDIMQLFFLLSSFYFFNKSLLSKEKKFLFFSLSSFFIGCFIATKFYATGTTIILAYGLTLLILKRVRDFFIFLATTLIALFILLGSYVPVLFHGYPLRDFLGIQKYVFLYHKSQLIYPFSIWSLLLFNKWYVWFGNSPIISDPQWRITWFFTTVIGVISSVFLFIKNTPNTIFPLLLWVLAYLGFFSFGQISSRYLVILFPILYLVSVYAVERVVRLYWKKYHR